ncbi:MAG: hypothetical protein Q8O70_00670, partial [Burkholderiales bacterium]|nr:hypothetical protein [Burkholderiales bacterium]
MTRSKQLIGLLKFMGVFMWVVAYMAPATAQEPTLAKEAVRVCTKCHDETEKQPVLSNLKSKHAVMADKRTPFADQACITCHGKSEDHL